MTGERADAIGSIIIAAHDEAAVIARTLRALEPVASTGRVAVFVVCNGCSDDTASIARGFAGVTVAELTVASKVAALREGDRLAASGPRIYLDADIVLSARAAVDVLTALSTGAIAGRPPHTFDAAHASLPVRRWYTVRERLPSIATALWGAGCYALSPEGRARFGEFPDIVSDDLFIDALFSRDEVTIVPTDAVVVRTPGRVADLVRILRRSYRTQAEVDAESAVVSSGQRAQLRDLARLLLRQPWRIADAAIYVGIVLYSRLRARTAPAARWERDESSRAMTGDAAG